MTCGIAKNDFLKLIELVLQCFVDVFVGIGVFVAQSNLRVHLVKPCLQRSKKLFLVARRTGKLSDQALMEVLEFSLDESDHVATAPFLVTTRSFSDIALYVIAEFVELYAEGFDNDILLSCIGGFLEVMLQVGCKSIHSIA